VRPEELDKTDGAVGGDTDQTEAGTVDVAPGGMRRIWSCLRETRLAVMVVGWWFLFLTLNTDNSLARLLSVDPDAFQIEASAVDYAIVVGGYLCALLLAVALLWVGLGRRASREMLQTPRDPRLAGGRTLGRFGRTKLAVLYAALCLAALVVSSLLTQLLPSDYFDSLPYVLSDVQFESARVCAVVCVTDLCLMAFHKMVVATAVAWAVGTERFRSAPMWKWAAAALLVFAAGSLLNASPLRGPVLYCALLYGPGELASAWYFYRSRDLASTVAVSWAVSELFAYTVYVLIL